MDYPTQPGFRRDLGFEEPCHLERRWRIKERNTIGVRWFVALCESVETLRMKRNRLRQRGGT